MKASFSFAIAGIVWWNAAAQGGDWPQWRGPLRNGVAPESPRLLETWPGGKLKELWDSEPIPADDAGGLGSPVVADGRVYLSVVWHRNVPSETRQLDELVVRQLGHQHTGALGGELVKKMEETRASLSPQLRGKKLEEFTADWIAKNLDARQQQFYSFYVTERFRKGAAALPLDVLDKLAANQDRVFANDPALRAWLDEQGWSEEVKQQVLAAIPPTRRVAEDTIVCLDSATGKTLWKRTVPGEPTGRDSSGTACVSDGRVFAIGSASLHCAEASSGKLLWSTPLPKKRVGSSPLAAQGLVVVNARDLVAYDAANGQVRWEKKKFSGNHSSPVLWQTGDQWLVIANGNKGIQAFDLATGATAWEVPGGSDSTPAIDGDTLAVQSQKELGLVVYKLTADRAEKLWNIPNDAARTQSSPLIYEGRVYLFDDDQLRSFDLADGRVRWQERIPGSIASPALADGKLFVMANNGNNVAMLKPGGDARIELGRANVRAAWVPSPAIADGRLILRLKDRLRCFSLTEPAP